MNTKFKHVMTAMAVLILGLSSCSSDDEKIGGTVDNGQPAALTLKIVQPKTYAVDPNATAAETAVNTVDVFIYDGVTSTFLKHQQLTLIGGDFTVNAGTNVVTASTKITTTTGAKNIYVGINLPAATVAKVTTGGPSAVNDINAVSDLNAAANGFAMFSRNVSVTTLAADDTDPANTITATVARLLSKVSVEKSAALAAATLPVSGGNISNLEFAVSNNNKKFFALPDNVTFKDPNWLSATTSALDFYKALAADYKAVNDNGTAITLANVVYTTENTSDGIIQNQRTYATIRGQFAPANIVKLNIPGDGTSALEADAAIVPGSTFYMVTVAGVRNYFTNQVDAQAYATTNAVAEVTYTNGWAYYNVFLNPAPNGAEHKFDVLRNNIYKVTITKINGIGEGNDGDGGLDPIDEPTNITVNVDIEPWTINSQESEI